MQADLEALGFVVRLGRVMGHLRDGRRLLHIEFYDKQSSKYYRRALSKGTVFHMKNGHRVVTCLIPIGSSPAVATLKPMDATERLIGFHANQIDAIELDMIDRVDTSDGLPYMSDTTWIRLTNRT